MSEAMQRIQDRVQQLYNIPLKRFTPEDAAELRALDQEACDMGYERELDDSPSGPIRVKYVPKVS